MKLEPRIITFPWLKRRSNLKSIGVCVPDSAGEQESYVATKLQPRAIGLVECGATRVVTDGACDSTMSSVFGPILAQRTHSQPNNFNYTQELTSFSKP